ncbi:hypothetical protein [Burkholderia sp. AU45388]|uniref:hypothetical protein n=1 Tax=Burkholderia sp. AU45388 TaxID=3059206 RepID=UPI00265640EE|nr:hypothetical protein [Burkholderia sp. AU45388]MDN7427414.1 hypothetical protein [Burkholderia sp. AU45388]
MSFKLIDRKPAHPDSSHHRTRSAILDAVTAACCPFGSKPFDGMGMLMDLRPAVLALSRMAHRPPGYICDHKAKYFCGSIRKTLFL